MYSYDLSLHVTTEVVKGQRNKHTLHYPSS